MTAVQSVENIDLELYNQFKTGSREAYQSLFEKYYPQLVRFAMVYVKDSDIAEEIVQDLFVKLWIKKDTLKIKSAFKSYLFSAVRNRAFNYFRDKKEYLNVESDLPLIDKISSHQDSTNFDFEKLQAAVKSAIEALPEKCRKIFRMSREEELTYKQIAEKLDVSPKTVENQMGIALKKLRESLQPILKCLVSLLVLLFK